MPNWKPRNTRRARELRNAATPAERRIWQFLNRSQLGAKFSRQMEITPFYADFLCRELKLVVELDGHSHDIDPGYDARRDAFIASKGFHLLRYTNSEVFENLEGVLRAISEEIDRLRLLTPSRLREGSETCQLAG